jgi:flagellar hook-associated protein 3 FlgL
MPNNDMQYYLRRQEEGLASIQGRIAGQSRLQSLRDDPLAASHAVRYESYLARLGRYETNTLSAKEHLNFTDSYLRSANDIMQRVREIAVAGANGIYTQEDTQKMAVEVNELLKELVSIANATGADGKQLFSGDKAFTEPFRVVEGAVPWAAGEAMPVQVEYRGAGAARRTEIGEQNYAGLDIAGGEAFWAEKMQVFSSVNADNYRVGADTHFFVDGVQINATAGDTVQAIAAKINESAAPVKAYLDPDSRGLVLEGTDAHLIRLEDAFHSQNGVRLQVGAVLSDLGLVKGSVPDGAPNWADDAKVSGGSIFDVVIRLRDALYRGDTQYVGGQGLGGVDLGMNNLRTRIAVVGSRVERVEAAWRRVNEEIPNTNETLSREAGLDMASAAVELGMMDFAHRAALQTAAKVLPQTLLDFLR